MHNLCVALRSLRLRGRNHNKQEHNICFWRWLSSRVRIDEQNENNPDQTLSGITCFQNLEMMPFVSKDNICNSAHREFPFARYSLSHPRLRIKMPEQKQR